MAASDHEIEIKLALDDDAAATRLLRCAGFRVSRRKVFESNTVFDTPGRNIRQAGCLLRVREAGQVATVTYKGPSTAGRHKSREEIEFGITDAGAIGRMLTHLGFEPAFRYEKYRTEYRRPRSRGLATLDRTPIGVFLELEGDPQWIDRVARELGFSEAEYITASYGGLYLDWCARHGVAPGHMVFASRRRK